MTGKWVYRQADQHRCDLPKITAWGDCGGISVGDIWVCECDRAWIVRDQQRDGRYWDRANAEDLKRRGL